MTMEDEKLISLLEGMESRLKTDLKAELKSELGTVEVRLKAELKAEINSEREFLVRALDRIESNLDRKIVDLKEEMQRMDRRFDQINVRQKRIDTVWKVALDWGREADTMDSARDQLIADLRHDVTDLRKRLEGIERKQQ